MSSGRVAATSGRVARDSSATSTTLAVDCLTMPMPIVSRPLPRKSERSSSAPNSTRATSPRRTTTPSSPFLTTSWANSSGVWNGRSMRAVKIRSCEVSDAGGRLDVLGADGAFDIADGEAAGGDGAAVEPDAHRGRALAADLDACDAVDRGEAVNEVALGVVGELERRALVGRDAGATGRSLPKRPPSGRLADRLPAAAAGGCRPTRSRTSLAAESMLREMSNSIEMIDWPSWLDELMNRMPSTPEMRSSMTSGDAGFDDVGGGALIGRADRDDRRVDVGYSRSARRVNDTPPMAISRSR